MTKFASQAAKTNARGRSPIRSTDTVTTNHGGATAYTRDAKSDLFLLGVSNFVSEDTFYESANARDKRFLELVHTVTREDPEWVERFVPWLRNEANMRSASVVAAVEYARAGGPNPSKVIDSACSRADEPAEVLAYWISKYGKPIPSSVKRGAAKAARRLYNQYSFLKYDSNSRTFRFADVIQLAHVKPQDDVQSALFKAALDARYSSPLNTELLPMVAAAGRINRGEVSRDELLRSPDLLKQAGMTWEQLSGLGAMDKAAWEAVIPNMGYMALLRNLRNFEQAGISDKMTQFVVNKLGDPDEVARSRQLPFRFWSAYKNAQGMQWGPALEKALGYSLQNLPAFGGNTLVLVDTSASMTSMGYTRKSTVTPAQAAAIFGAALALKGENVDFRGFANGVFKHDISKGGSVLRAVDAFLRRIGEVGHGTNVAGALQTWYGHDRVVLISDMQTLAGFGNSGYGYGYHVQDARAVGIPRKVPVYGFNLNGYSNTQIGTDNQYEFGGLTDHTFKMIPLLERGAKADWPF